MSIEMEKTFTRYFTCYPIEIDFLIALCYNLYINLLQGERNDKKTASYIDNNGYHHPFAYRGRRNYVGTASRQDTDPLECGGRGRRIQRQGLCRIRNTAYDAWLSAYSIFRNAFRSKKKK
jgi:hypothetical protein